jgi:hypothetical protein
MKTTRRQFLQKTAGTAGALAVSPKFLVNPDSITSRLEPVAPSDRIRFGIIGVGMQGSGLLTSALTLPGIECVAAADLYDGRHTLAQEIVYTTGPKDSFRKSTATKSKPRASIRNSSTTRTSTASSPRFPITGTSRWLWTL